MPRIFTLLLLVVALLPFDPSAFGEGRLAHIAVADEWQRFQSEQARQYRLQMQRRQMQRMQQYNQTVLRQSQQRRQIQAQLRVQREAQRTQRYRQFRDQMRAQTSLRARMSGDYARFVRTNLRTRTQSQYVSKFSASRSVADRVLTRLGPPSGRIFATSIRGYNSRNWVRFHDARGGHTQQRHVAKSQNYLRERLANSPKMPFVSSFTNVQTAQRAIASAIRSDRNMVRSWLRDGSKRNLEVKYQGRSSLGYGVRRDGLTQRNLNSATIILKKDGKGGYYVLTAFPHE